MNTKITCLLLFCIFLLPACTSKNQPGTFESGEKTFLLNGQPMLVKAAEIHYPRIPRDYWEHRIEMCKSLGMNTICLYVFWNIHEQEEGKFDFKGQNDIAAFCRLAQKHGMWVIVRPGPYVCAEWEMGGLPWWLLKKKEIALRTQDPYFMERTRIFMKEVGKQLADLQITRGGNIIMVQVENEYGAYGTDKPYVSDIRDIVKEAGFTDVPLFQCDWSSNFLNNALDDLLWTINFGTGANIEKQFEKLSELRPNTPLMCSEFWSGWFDHWGRKHETRSAAALVDGLKQMLDRNISFSLYMTHGGTTFGHWGGANSPAYSAMCSSYDYDAPISESGRTTPKYFEVQKLLKNYLPEGESLPPVPDSIPTIALPVFELTETAGVYENLPEPVHSENALSMEEVNQGWGTILYRTRLQPSEKQQSLQITHVHDWAQVFVNGEKVGTLDRRKGESTLLLPPVGEGAILDIYVEAMGRVNFGKAIHDFKGITEKVELKTRDYITELKNWEIFSFPVDYDFVKNKEYKKSSGKETMPAYYRGTFTIEKTGDTFLDMRTWGKGMVWVNGYAIGRFWEIGPQQTLYLPGCWLKKGKNEIIILDIAGPSENKIAGLRKPILDMLRVKEAITHRAPGQDLNLKSEKPFYKGTFKSGNGWQDISFGKTVKARYFCLESLNSFGNDDYASIAELEVMGADGKPIDRQNWKIIYADSEETEKANNSADKIYDLQESTFWHTNYSSSPGGHPHQIVIDLGAVYDITGYAYLPRPEKNFPGMIKDYRIYLKEDPFKFE
ncbi:MAG: beta-galactosidase [Bacteroidales bacterium]|jgi:beta-galactosidase|nr:beta-galactosidase [Bacteroidales bacterium]